LKEIQWIIIGKLTGSKKVKLDSYWIAHIENEAKRHNIPIFEKDNLGLKNPVQEFPECEGAKQ